MLNWLLAVRNPDPDAQRRGRNTIVIAIGLMLMSLASVPLVLIQPDPAPQLVGAIGGVFLQLPTIILARRGRVTLAALLLLSLTLSTLFGIPLLSRQIGLVPVFFVVGVLTASVIARPWVVGLSMLVAIVAIISQGALLAAAPQVHPSAAEISAVGALLAGIAGLIGALGARSNMQSLDAAQQARASAEAAALALDRMIRQLEDRVVERTAALRTALADSEQRTAEQARLLTENTQQRETLRTMSVPVLPVAAQTLVMPLVGTLDAERLALVQHQALAAIITYKARKLLIDITGVPFVDDQVAAGLIAVIGAAHLLGVTTTLIGIRPEVAQTLVSTGVDLTQFRTARDLQAALAN
jgi:rsbT co-antagonist protein RsbR